MKSTKVQPPGVIRVQLYSSIIKFTPIGFSNVDRVSVAAKLISHRSDHRRSISEVQHIEERWKHRTDNVTEYRPHAHAQQSDPTRALVMY